MGRSRSLSRTTSTASPTTLRKTTDSAASTQVTGAARMHQMSTRSAETRPCSAAGYTGKSTRDCSGLRAGSWTLACSPTCHARCGWAERGCACAVIDADLLLELQGWIQDVRPCWRRCRCCCCDLCQSTACAGCGREQPPGERGAPGPVVRVLLSRPTWPQLKLCCVDGAGHLPPHASIADSCGSLPAQCSYSIAVLHCPGVESCVPGLTPQRRILPPSSRVSAQHCVSSQQSAASDSMREGPDCAVPFSQSP